MGCVGPGDGLRHRGLIALIVLAVKAVSGTQPGSSSGALELLKRRLAAGEITQDEYEKTRRILEG